MILFTSNDWIGLWTNSAVNRDLNWLLTYYTGLLEFQEMSKKCYGHIFSQLKRFPGKPLEGKFTYKMIIKMGFFQIVKKQIP